MGAALDISGLEHIITSPEAGVTRKIFMTDTHFGHNDDIMLRTASLFGASSLIHLGDLLGAQVSKVTENEMRAALAIGRELQNRESEMYKAAIEGKFSDAQLRKIGTIAENANKWADENARRLYQRLADSANRHGIELEVVIPGNHDRKKVMKNVFGKAYIEQGVTSFGNAPIAVTGGGGSYPADMAHSLDPKSDDVGADLFKEHHRGWEEIFKEKRGIKGIISHQPHNKRAGGHADPGTDLMEDLHIRFLANGIGIPEWVASGHIHTDTIVEFNKKTGQLDFRPGVGSAELRNNRGDKAQFATADFDENGRIKRVLEFHVYNKADGTQDVQLHAVHTPDYNTKEVTKKEIKRWVFEGAAGPDLSAALEGDPNQRLMHRGFMLDYNNLSAEQKAERLRFNLALLEAEAEDIGNRVKRVVDTVRRETGLNPTERNQRVYEELGKIALHQMEVDIGKLCKEEGDEAFFRNIATHFLYGVSMTQVHQLLAVQDNEHLPHNWGDRLIGTVVKSTVEHNEDIMFNGLDEKELTEMLMTYIPQGYQLKVPLSYLESKALLKKAHERNFLSPSEVEGSGLFEEIPGFRYTKRTEADVEKLVKGFKFAEREQYEKLKDIGEKNVKEKEKAELQQYVGQGGPVITVLDRPNDYIIQGGPRGQLIPVSKDKFADVEGVKPMDLQQFEQYRRSQLEQQRDEIDRTLRKANEGYVPQQEAA